MAKITTTHGILNNKIVTVYESDDWKEDLCTPANAVTMSGIVTLGWAVYCILSNNLVWIVPLLFMYGAGISDVLDGYVAELTNRYSRIGRFMDPVRDRATIIFLALIMLKTEASMIWLMPLLIVVLVELRIAYFNLKHGNGSHVWGKRRYLIHFAVMTQYVCQTYWDFWPVEISGVMVTVFIAFGSLLALPDVYKRFSNF